VTEFTLPTNTFVEIFDTNEMLGAQEEQPNRQRMVEMRNANCQNAVRRASRLLLVI
jgi:hypothetical protein